MHAEAAIHAVSDSGVPSWNTRARYRVLCAAAGLCGGRRASGEA